MSGDQHIRLKMNPQSEYLSKITSHFQFVTEIKTDTETDLSWIDLLGKHDLSDKELANVMIGIDSFAQKELFLQLENVLLDSLNHDTPKLILVTALRVTSSYKDKMVSWTNILDKAIIWLSNRNIDPNKALIGLI
jgi:hypothetical protein